MGYGQPLSIRRSEDVVLRQVDAQQITFDLAQRHGRPIDGERYGKPRVGGAGTRTQLGFIAAEERGLLKVLHSDDHAAAKIF